MPVNVGQVGHQLFGRALRLKVLMWAYEEEHRTFYLTEAAEGVRYSASGVREELRRLVKLGMLRRDHSEGGRRVYFTRTDSSLWDIVGATRDALAGLPAEVEDLDAADAEATVAELSRGEFP